MAAQTKDVLLRLRKFCTRRSTCAHLASRRTLSTAAARAVTPSEKFSPAELDDALYSTTTLYPENYAVGKVEKSPYSIRRQTAAEGEWLQDDDEETASMYLRRSADTSQGRFDWRLRASSRVKRVKPKDGQKPVYPRRIRPPGLELDTGRPYFGAFERYRSKFLKLLAEEEAEDEEVLRQRLSTWSVKRLEDEGYCITGLSAYWLQANQFGRPVASFVLGPGINLPDNKLENGTQVLLSRIDPLKEVPETGSVLSRTESHIRVCFPNQFDLNDGVWRLDLGRPNLMYERMRTAISYFEHDPNETQQMDGDDTSRQYILQGTELRDVLLKSFQPSTQAIAAPDAEQALVELQESVERDINAVEKPLDLEVVPEFPFENMGAFKEDQRIVSWVKRYSREDPIVMDSDPPLGQLNTSQKRAMAAMIGRRMSLIQGPPGTGKTKTIIETTKLLKVHFEVPQPILVCTYTNVAVDNLVEGFAKVGVKPLRVGFNGNVRESLLQHSLDYKLEQHPLHPALLMNVEEECGLVARTQGLAKDYHELMLKLKEAKRPRKKTVERAENMQQALSSLERRHKNLKKKIFAMQQEMLRDCVADADVICTTCVTAACAALNMIDFPVVFLDEASMSTEPASLIPIMKGSQHIALIGDHKQLPPVIVSQKAKEGGLAVSLFERLTEEGHVHSVMLDMQYRMHPDISQFPAKEFYDLALRDGTVDDVGNALPGLEPPKSRHLVLRDNERPSVIFLDHTGNESFKGRSRVNITEAHIVASVVEDLLLTNKHLKGQDIGVIAPYAAQITLLTRLLNADPSYQKRFREVLGAHRAMQLSHIEIKTVDGFEGREKEVIIFSTVRNNAAGHIGFLADRKRLNVGLTRAKRGLFVIGSIATLRAGKIGREGGQSSVGADIGLVVGEVTGASAVAEKKTKPKKVAKGNESWKRYADFLTQRNLIISLEGRELQGALYGHWDALKKDSGQEDRILL